MNRFSGILKIIFIILIFITVGEIGYYLYIQYSNKTNLPAVTAESTPISIANLIPTETPNLFTQNDPNRAVSTSMVLGLLLARKGILTSSILTNQYAGEIVELDTKGGTVPFANFKYKLRLRIKSQQDNFQNLYLAEQDENIIKTAKKTNTGEESITLSQLKPKDKVIIQSSIDLTKEPDSNLIEMKITKI